MVTKAGWEEEKGVAKIRAKVAYRQKKRLWPQVTTFPFQAPHEIDNWETQY